MGKKIIQDSTRLRSESEKRRNELKVIGRIYKEERELEEKTKKEVEDYLNSPDSEEDEKANPSTTMSSNPKDRILKQVVRASVGHEK